MNKYVQAIVSLDVERVKEMLRSQSDWCSWAQPDGKNALHFVCGVPVVVNWNTNANTLGEPDDAKVVAALAIAKLVVRSGLDINSVHKVPEKNGAHFPATAVWYAYTRGRNEKLYRWLLKNGASAAHCMSAITWYDDAHAADLFKSYGALDSARQLDECLLAAIGWKKLAMIEWLLRNGADANAHDAKGNSALTLATKKKLPAAVVAMMIRHGSSR